MRRKRIALAAALLALIIAAAAVAVHRAAGPAAPADRDRSKAVLVLAEPPFTLKQVSQTEFQTLARDPETGYYRMDGKLWTTPGRCCSGGAPPAETAGAPVESGI